MSLASTVLRGPIRPFDEIQEDLDFTVGDVTAKHSRFWLLLLLSGVIASAGVLSNSTATVIGAMIIAPLATPIQAIAYAMVSGQLLQLRKAAALLVGGGAAVVGVGFVTAVVMPEFVPLATNSQITGRVSPTLIDLLAAVATGFAGALGIARRDISDILPGVAIAISLVPPLAVIGVTAQAGAWGDSLGALTLFLANVLAIILTASAVFAAMGLKPEQGVERKRTLRSARIVVGVSVAIVVLSLTATTVRTAILLNTQNNAKAAAAKWATPQEAKVLTAKMEGSKLKILVAGSEQPSNDGLLAVLRGAVPKGTAVDVILVRDARARVGDVP